MYGAGNIGDDLILDSAIEIYRKENINTQISFVSYNPIFHRNIYPSYMVYGVTKKEKIRSVFNNDIIVVAGGTACQDKMGAGFLSGILFWYIEYLFLARLFGKRIVFWSIGCDKITTFWGKSYASLLRYADIIIVRDPISKKNIKNYINHKKIFVYPDLAYSYMQYKVTISNKIYVDLLAAKDKNIVLINILDEFITKELHFNYIKKLILTEKNSVFVFVNSEVRAELDNLAVKKLFKSFGNIIPDNIMYLGTNYFTSAELNQIINLADSVIAMRMHLSILALLNHKKIFIISRSDKTKSFSELNDIVYWDLDVDISYEEFKLKFNCSHESNNSYLNKIAIINYLSEFIGYYR